LGDLDEEEDEEGEMRHDEEHIGRDLGDLALDHDVDEEEFEHGESDETIPDHDDDDDGDDEKDD